MMRLISFALAALGNHRIFAGVLSGRISKRNATSYSNTSRISFQDLLNRTIRRRGGPRRYVRLPNSSQPGSLPLLGRWPAGRYNWRPVPVSNEWPRPAKLKGK